MTYVRRLFLFVVISIFVTVGARQVYAVCNPPECGGRYGTCQERGWESEYYCFDQCCVIPTSGGGPTPTPGGGGYDWFQCPAGTGKSCGSPAEAQSQNKYGCLYRSYCDTYFSPELIGAGCDADNPAKAYCQWNCSCCPTGSYRSCTLGTSCIITATKER